jgi:hypothetical protein
LNEIHTPHDNARDPLDAIRALDARLPLAMQNADLHLLAAVRGDLTQRWRDEDADGTEDRP